jgi:hypothetical protein
MAQPSMNNNNQHNRLPAGLMCLLLYQGFLTLCSLGYTIAAVVELVDMMGPSSYVAGVGEVLMTSSVIIVLAGWTAAMIYASVEIVRRRPRGFFLGMLFHLLLEVVGWSFVLFLLGAALVAVRDKDGRGWAGLFLLFAFLWLPFLLPSLWAYSYLRRCRASLLSQVAPNKPLQQTGRP